MKKQMAQFAVAGGIGFLADAAVLYLSLWLGLGYFAGRLVSFLCAVFVTWRINRRFAFGSVPKRSTWLEWWHYLVAMSLGGLVNYAVYSAVILLAAKRPEVPFIAVGIGSVAAMTLNFVNAKLWVFRGR